METEQHSGQQQKQVEKPQNGLPETPALQTPPPQTQQSSAPVLQTPAHEERGVKRQREDSTPLSGPSGQPEAKRQRADSPEVEDITDDVLDIEKDKESSLQTGTSSFQQEQNLQVSLEVASQSQQSKKPKSTKASFIEIKAQNELLRQEVYK